MGEGHILGHPAVLAEQARVGADGRSCARQHRRRRDAAAGRPGRERRWPTRSTAGSGHRSSGRKMATRSPRSRRWPAVERRHNERLARHAPFPTRHPLGDSRGAATPHPRGGAAPRATPADRARAGGGAGRLPHHHPRGSAGPERRGLRRDGPRARRRQLRHRPDPCRRSCGTNAYARTRPSSTSSSTTASPSRPGAPSSPPTGENRGDLATMRESIHMLENRERRRGERLPGRLSPSRRDVPRGGRPGLAQRTALPCHHGPREATSSSPSTGCRIPSTWRPRSRDTPMILQAIRSGDARAAASAMESHLERTRIELGTIILMMTGRMSDGRANGGAGA